MDIQKLLDESIIFILDFGPKIIGAILIWLIGSWIIKKLTKGISKLMITRNYDESLQKFLVNLLGWGLKILLILAVLGTVGVETTSFAVILAATGLAIGLALHRSLKKFTGGILIMMFKPFKIGI
ncbi:mechanosensitive ion channel family protein [Aquimarina sp. M1]